MWTPIQMPSIEASAGYGAKGSQGLNPNSHGSCSVTTTSGAKPLGDVQSIVATQKSWTRDSCTWNLDKKHFKKYEQKWKDILKSEWHPDVEAQLGRRRE